ncbi:MAG: imidazolonepropionase [Rhodoferax sp.]|nr:imidazolonepropionase [Rhodoferax sp.]HQX57845.1 imidazolonepropionase [Burkholderiaceae bacterium]
MAATTLWRNARLATLADNTDWGLVDNGALLVQSDRLAWVGSLAELPDAMRGAITHEVDLGGALVTPGLVDCHTHLVYGGLRAREFELRLQGASYEEIARAGGGIRATVAATRGASDTQLHAAARKRALALMGEGVTSIEIKSGYGLSLEHERRCLAIARALGRELPVSVFTTYLAAHAVPPEFDGRADDYIDAVCRWMPALHAQGLIDAVDAFCENIGFSPAQTRRVFETACGLGLPVKLHAEQLSNQDGARLAAEFGALSCDHLEWLSDAGITSMRASGSVAVLLPGAYYYLRDTKLPPIAAIRAAGVPMALATDHNPGSSPGLSLLLMVNMACTLFRLTPLEAVLGVTAHGARALGRNDRGRLVAGNRADFVAWDLQHPHELAYWFGHNPCQRVIAGGKPSFE